FLPPGVNIPSFAAGRATVESFSFLDGGLGIVSVAGRGLEIQINNGDNWKLPGIPEFGPAVIDWATTFPAELLGYDSNGDGVLNDREVDGVAGDDPLPAALTAADTLGGTVPGDGEVTLAELIAYYDTVVDTHNNGVLELADHADLQALQDAGVASARAVGRLRVEAGLFLIEAHPHD
ncbi:MAG: hypothetical protein ACO2YV_10485, partial [Pseudomonadales bacterium]